MKGAAKCFVRGADLSISEVNADAGNACSDSLRCPSSSHLGDSTTVNADVEQATGLSQETASLSLTEKNSAIGSQQPPPGLAYATGIPVDALVDPTSDMRDKVDADSRASATSCSSRNYMVIDTVSANIEPLQMNQHSDSFVVASTTVSGRVASSLHANAQRESGNEGPQRMPSSQTPLGILEQHSDSLLAASATVTGRVATSLHDKNVPLLQLQNRALRLRNQLWDNGVECVDALASWSGLKRILALGGFDVETDCGWQALGLASAEGPAPTQDDIECRADYLELVLSARSRPDWPEEDRSSAQTVADQVIRFKEQCLRELFTFLKLRKKHYSAFLPRFAEVDEQLVAYLHDRMQPVGGRVGICLSNLLKTDHSKYGSLLCPLDARHLVDALARGPTTGAAALAALPPAGAVVWLPRTFEHCQSFLTSFVKYAEMSTDERKLELLIPHSVFPTCRTTGQIRDLWTHPILGGKWSSIVSKIEFLTEPAKMVLEGKAGPIFVERSFALITLSTRAISCIPTMVPWRATLSMESVQSAVVVDFLAHNEMRVRQALYQLGDIGITRWEGPIRSLGSSDHCRRLALRGYVGPRLAPVDVRLLIMRLKREEVLREALIGQLSLFSDSNSKLVDMCSCEVLALVDSLIDEVVVASPRLAIIQTLATKAAWQDVLTRVAAEDESIMIDGIRDRMSAGGRPWVRPACLVPPRGIGQMLGRSCANAHKIVQIKVPGLRGAQRKVSLDRLMRAAAMRLGRAWEEVPYDTALKCAQWQHCLDPDGNVSGRIFLCLESPSEAEQVKISLAGAVVSLGAEPRLLSIEHLVHLTKTEAVYAVCKNSAVCHFGK